MNTLKVGDTATMLFHGFGMVSEEVHEVIHVDGDVITLETDEDFDKCFRFNTKTGRCRNDNTFGGCHRTLKLD